MDKDIELLSRAKMYMELLADGTDPISGLRLPDDTVLKNSRLNRCFLYVSDVLHQLIEKGGIAALVDMNSQSIATGKTELPPLVLSSEQLSNIPVSDKPLDVNAFTRNVNRVVDSNSMKKLNGASFSSWLIKKGFLEKIGTQRKPTAHGEAIGITLKMKQTSPTLLKHGRDRSFSVLYVS